LRSHILLASEVLDVHPREHQYLGHAKLAGGVFYHLQRVGEAGVGDLPAGVAVCASHGDGKDLVREVGEWTVLALIEPVGPPTGLAGHGARRNLVRAVAGDCTYSCSAARIRPASWFVISPISEMASHVARSDGCIVHPHDQRGTAIGH
jgi:hypothetical protein